MGKGNNFKTEIDVFTIGKSIYNPETGGVCYTRKQINKIKGFKDQWGKRVPV